MLVGCIGGIGFFLFQVSFEVIFKRGIGVWIFEGVEVHLVVLWVICLVLPLVFEVGEEGV